MSGKEPIEQIEKNDPWYTVNQVSASQRRRQRLVIADRIRFIVGALEAWRDETYRRRGGKRKLKLLDAGCGDGVLLRPLTQLDGFEVYGLDYNPVRVERARENTPQATVKKGDLTSLTSLTRLGFKGGFFDAIVMSQVLEHIAEDRLVLQLMAELLSESGIFILGVPNEGCLLGKVRNKVLQPSIARTTDHVNFYTEKTITSKLAHAGFVVDRVERAGFFFPHEAFSICFNSWCGGYRLAQFLGRAAKSQVAGFHFVCQAKRVSSGGRK